MQTLPPYRPKAYPPSKRFVQWGDAQLGYDIKEADNALNQSLLKKIASGLQLQKDKRQHHMNELEATKMIPHYYIGERAPAVAAPNASTPLPGQMDDVTAAARPAHLPPLDGGDIPVPLDVDELDFEDANSGDIQVKEEPASEGEESKPLGSRLLDAAASAGTYMGTSLKNNLVDTVNLVKNTAVAGSQAVGVLAPELQKSAETYKNIASNVKTAVEVVGPPLVYGGYLAGQAAFDLTKFFAKAAWSLNDVLQAIHEASSSSSEIQALEDNEVGTMRLNGSQYRRGRNDTPPRRSQGSSSNGKTYESYNSVEEWKQHSHNSKTWLMEQIYKRDGWGKVMQVADNTTGYHRSNQDFRKKLLKMDADDMAQILLALDGKSSP